MGARLGRCLMQTLFSLGAQSRQDNDFIAVLK
jgi:hypothetical protein